MEQARAGLSQGYSYFSSPRGAPPCPLWKVRSRITWVGKLETVTVACWAAAEMCLNCGPSASLARATAAPVARTVAVLCTNHVSHVCVNDLEMLEVQKQLDSLYTDALHAFT